MATSTFKIYSIEGIDYDAVIAKYREMCEQGEREIDPMSISVYGGNVGYIQTRKPRKPLKDDTRIKNKAIYLIHIIAYRQLTNREDGVDIDGNTPLLEYKIGESSLTSSCTSDIVTLKGKVKVDIYIGVGGIGLLKIKENTIKVEYHW